MTPEERAVAQAEYARLGGLLTEEQRAREVAEWWARVGKCYRRTLTTESFYYSVVTGIDAAGNAAAFTFHLGPSCVEVDGYVAAEFATPNGGELVEYVEVPREEFDAALATLVARVQGMDPHAFKGG